jgi:nucleotide-binding universal stress UspA family protein
MYTKLLLPTDGSQVSHRAVAHAEALAQATGGCILAPEVIESRRDVLKRASAAGWLSTGDGFISNEHADQLVDAQRRSAQTHLAALRAELSRGGVDLFEERIEQGTPGPVIVRVANAEGCDGIVIATHGRTGQSKLFMGSVAEYVLRHAACPAILVPSPARVTQPATDGTPIETAGGAAV